MDDEYNQPDVLLFSTLPTDALSCIVVALNGGAIDSNAEPKRGFLYPGLRGGRELHYFQISRDAMTFWKHVCKYLRGNYNIDYHIYDLLFANNAPRVEMWSDPNIDDYGSAYMDYHNSRQHFVPRHLYAGDPKPWIKQLCCGPQTHDEALAVEAAEEAKIAAQQARKQKRKQKRRRLA